MLSILNQTKWHLFKRSFETASLNNLPRLLCLTHSHQESRCEQPNFPFDILRAAQHWVSDEANSFLKLTGPLVHLGRLYVYFPLKLLVYILMQVVQDILHVVKSFLLQSAVCFLVQSQVLEPERSVPWINVQTIFTEIKGLDDAAFTLFIPTCLKVDWPIANLRAQFWKQGSCFRFFADSPLELRTLHLHSPLITISE